MIELYTNNMDIKLLSDSELLKMISNDRCSDATKEIIKRHEKSVYNTIYKFCIKNPNININDLLDDKYSIFNQAIKTYRSDKNTKFLTWLTHQAYFWCLNANKNAYKSISLENKDIDKISNSRIKFCSNSINNKENHDYIMNLLKQIDDKRIGKIFHMRYFDGKGNKTKTWKEICKEMNLSITGVINLHKKGRDIIFNKINSNEKPDTI